MTDIIKNIVIKFIIGIIIITLLSVGMIWYGYDDITWIFTTVGIVVVIFMSKIYLLFLLKVKTKGVIRNIEIKAFANKKRPSEKMENAIIDERHPAYGLYYERFVVITLQKENGKYVEKKFPFNKFTEKLKTGDKIEYCGLDTFPRLCI